MIKGLSPITASEFLRMCFVHFLRDDYIIRNDFLEKGKKGHKHRISYVYQSRRACLLGAHPSICTPSQPPTERAGVVRILRKKGPQHASC
jgi:hypothetical protein